MSDLQRYPLNLCPDNEEVDTLICTWRRKEQTWTQEKTCFLLELLKAGTNFKGSMTLNAFKDSYDEHKNAAMDPE